MTTQSNLHVIAIWDSPPQYVARSVHIPIEHATALALMNTNSQRLTNKFSARATSLRSILCVNQFHSTASAFSLASQDGNELAPASIADTTGQPAVPQQPCDVEAFRSDDAVSVNQRTCDFVVHVLADISHLGVKSRNTLFNELSSIAPLFASAQCALSPAEFGQCSFECSAIAERFAIGCRDERLQANVDANTRAADGRLGIGNLSGKAHEPLVAFAKNCNRSDVAFRKLAMPSNSHHTYPSEPQFPIDNFPSADFAECERIKAIATLESRVSRIAALFAAAEESRVCAIERPKSLCSRVRINSAKVLIQMSLLGEPKVLVWKGPVVASCFPAEHLSVERTVVESAMRFKNSRKLSLLVSVCEQAVFEVSHHA